MVALAQPLILSAFTTQSKVTQLCRAFSEGITPSVDVHLADWSDEFRILPQVSSSESGPWRTERFPYLREPMYELSPESPTQEVVVMKGSQTGFTEVALNLIFYTVHRYPGPLLYVQKTIETVEKFSRQRLAPSIELMPCIRELIAPPRSQESVNTIRMKNFPGGVIMLGGANSAASLRSIPVQILILDEEESYESDIETEGNPSDLAIRRTSNFPRRKIFRLSTPLIQETSVIEPLFQSGDQRYYNVPCIHCEFPQVITFESLKWENDDPLSVRMQCQNCKKPIEEYHKTRMLEAGKWVKTFPGRRVASFHLSAFYSPLGFYSWVDAVTLFLEAHRTFNKSKLKVFVNTVEGRTWKATTGGIEHHGLLKRKEKYKAEVPQSVLALYAGCDVQNDRIETEVIGIGRHDESWSIGYYVLIGDTERNQVWENLDELLLRRFKHESGIEMQIACTGVDSGHRAEVVYNFCKPREFRRIFPVKGLDGWGKGYIKRPKRRHKGIWLYMVMGDELKSKIYTQLAIADPGPGYCHFPDNVEYDKHYFRGLTAERLTTVKSSRPRLKWVLQEGVRNEPLDCRAYALSARYILGLDLDRLSTDRPVTGFGKKIKRKRTIVHSTGV